MQRMLLGHHTKRICRQMAFWVSSMLFFSVSSYHFLTRLFHSFTQANYLNASAPPYTYYVRKHNPHAVFDSITSIPARRELIRNFNDFAADLNASVIPQWNFITPNLVNDAHDTDIDFAADWLEYWLVPLLSDPAFNDNKTLIVLTFDENETFDINNRIYTLLLGGAVPERLRGTTDNTYYTHYSTLSTVENNWGLGSLGRGDTNKLRIFFFYLFMGSSASWLSPLNLLID